MLRWFKAYQDPSKDAESSHQTLLEDSSSDDRNDTLVSIRPNKGLAENRRLSWLLSIILGVTACAFVLSLLLYSRVQYFMVTDVACSRRMSAYSQSSPSINSRVERELRFEARPSSGSGCI